MPYSLSKSRFVTGMQCPKILWCKEHVPEQFDSLVMNEVILAAGNMVGDTGMEYFGEFAEVSFDRANIDAMVEATKKLKDEGQQIICEATYKYDNNLCMVDILRTDENGQSHIIEVKATTSFDKDKRRMKAYLYDMTYQYWVLTNSGVDVATVSIMYLNNQYTRQGDLDLQELFIVRDCTEEVLQLLLNIEGEINRLRKIVAKSSEPDIRLGMQCSNPYKCGFIGYCRRNFPEQTVLDIRGRLDSKFDLLYSGIETFGQVLESGAKLSNKQLLQVTHEVEDQKPHVDVEEIQAFLDTVSYPLYHLDFETFQQAIPQWNGVRPWMQIPFQYSLHIQDEQGVDPAHLEFLAIEGENPMSEFAKRLCEDIPTDVCVIAYNSPFEQMVLRNLADAVPEYASHLMSIHDNMIDLAEPFRKGHYYERGFEGSFSIKAILPTLFPNNQELDYKTLGIIQSGDEIMGLFPELHKQSAERRAEVRKALLAYCKLDTLAVVRILDRLYEV